MTMPRRSVNWAALRALDHGPNPEESERMKRRLQAALDRAQLRELMTALRGQ